MATARFFVLLGPDFHDDKQTRLKSIKAVDMRQTPPSPTNKGLWVQISIEVADAVFTHLVPHLVAKLESSQIEAMLSETSLHIRLMEKGDDP